MTDQIHIHAKAAFQSWGSSVQRACHSMLVQQGIQNGSLTVVLTDEDTIRQMNLEFAGEDHVTDVLSFPFDELDPENGLRYLGDIIIAVPVAQRQSESNGNELEHELCLLAIHGTLHLLGYDHAEDDAKKRMWELQDQVLIQLGIGDNLKPDRK
ncbi:MAG: rRNA maturation RNase YbeY [Anaerolineales bacterium]|nr:MAG: rRNA maturation RNase YbeY [Anaerolineales bacterium]